MGSHGVDLSTYDYRGLLADGSLPLWSATRSGRSAQLPLDTTPLGKHASLHDHRPLARFETEDQWKFASTRGGLTGLGLETQPLAYNPAAHNFRDHIWYTPESDWQVARGDGVIPNELPLDTLPMLAPIGLHRFRDESDQAWLPASQTSSWTPQGVLDTRSIAGWRNFDHRGLENLPHDRDWKPTLGAAEALQPLGSLGGLPEDKSKPFQHRDVEPDAKFNWHASPKTSPDKGSQTSLSATGGRVCDEILLRDLKAPAGKKDWMPSRRSALNLRPGNTSPSVHSPGDLPLAEAVKRHTLRNSSAPADKPGWNVSTKGKLASATTYEPPLFERPKKTVYHRDVKNKRRSSPSAIKAQLTRQRTPDFIQRPVNMDIKTKL